MLSRYATRSLAAITATGIEIFARLITAVRANWSGVGPVPKQRIYFANHSSNGDFVLVWTALPDSLRRRTRPVAGADYWLKSRLRRFIGREVFNAVLIDRNPETRTEDPMQIMLAALDRGDSLIIFPEGTRNLTEERLLPFKAGLYHLAKARPGVELVPVWIENLNRVMPKGELVPVPLPCSVRFGHPVELHAGETKPAFLTRARDALTAEAPEPLT